jgi:4-hydroxy-tetrahydrodipicolinate synthase
MSDGTGGHSQAARLKRHPTFPCLFGGSPSTGLFLQGVFMSTALHTPSAQPDFSGLWIPLITPFLYGEVDHASLRKLVKHYEGCGIAGLVVCGSTGEAAALDDEEQDAVLHTVMTAAPGLPVVMGVSGYHLGKTKARIAALGHCGLKGILLSAPSYIRPSQAGVIEWFTQLADASAVPLVVYDIPSRTGTHMAQATLLQLAAHPNIHAIKDCGGDMPKTLALIADGRLQVLAGDDANIFSTVAAGGAGAIAAASHLSTRRFARVIALLKAGDAAEARALWEPMLPLVEGVFAEPNPGPLKAVMGLQGWIADELRSPMTRASAALGERLQALDRQLGQDAG